MSKQAVKIKEAERPATVDEATALISMIERAARDPAVDVDKMERLLLMSERARAERAKAAFLAALSALQGELPAAKRKGTGHNEKKYARFEDFIEAVRPHLIAHGFSLSYRVEQPEGRVKISGVLGHSAGHCESTELSLPVDTTGNKNPVQALGSSVSYGKRYVGMTLLGMATEDDDDGKAAGDGATVTDKQADELHALIEATGSDIRAFCSYFKTPSLAELKAADFERAKAALMKKRGQS